LLGTITDSLFYVFLGALIILLVGLSDDLSPLPAWAKLLAQIAAGLTLYIGGLNVELLSTPYGSVDVGWLSVIITVGWVVVLTNAINLIDGLDGLAGGVSLISAVVMGIIGQLYRVGEPLLFICAMIGFLLPFLHYNRYPARIFLGDSGSLQIGFYFAVVSLVFPIKSFTFTALYVPLLALGVPVLETISSIMRRAISGKNLMQADRRHLFHYLALAGLSNRQTILVFYSLAIVFGIFALAMFVWDRKIVLGLLVVFMVVIFLLFLILLGKLPWRKNSSR
jgi:UDP-GlcNAc:undecaprenyl-phosphate GlcNAc-1-phosphate transferase